MVTFIVVLILIAVVIAFAVLLIIKKGKLAKKWFISFGGVVLAGIICITVSVIVSSTSLQNQLKRYNEEIPEVTKYAFTYSNIYGYYLYNVEEAKEYYGYEFDEIEKLYNEFIDKYNELDEWLVNTKSYCSAWWNFDIIPQIKREVLETERYYWRG